MRPVHPIRITTGSVRGLRPWLGRPWILTPFARHVLFPFGRPLGVFFLGTRTRLGASPRLSARAPRGGGFAAVLRLVVPVRSLARLPSPSGPAAAVLVGLQTQGILG